MADNTNVHKTKAEREAEGYYESFVEKFKPKKTTDDCITPEPVYAVVRDWVMNEYGIKPETRIVRPFWPGADYQAEDYSGDCVVIDNPPFSIISQIVRWYMERGIRFFLFAPAMSLFSVARGATQYIVVGAATIYENGANVCTSFVTNMDKYKIRCVPELVGLIETACKKPDASPSKYDYPDCVCTAARLQKIPQHGCELRIKPEDAYYIGGTLDAQRKAKKSIFGTGFLISEKAAAEKAAAREAIIWELSEREKEIQRSLGG